MKKSITINMEDSNNIHIQFTGNVSYEEMTKVFFTALQANADAIIKTYKEQNPGANPQPLINQIFDDINQYAAVCLNAIDPLSRTSTTLTEQAILNEENRIMDKELRRMKKDPNYKTKLVM